MPEDENDKYYTDPYRFGEKNLRLRQLNRNRNLSGVKGYPSDQEYMKLVGDAGIESQQNRMRQATYEQVGKKKPKKKVLRTTKQNAKRPQRKK